MGKLAVGGVVRLKGDQRTFLITEVLGPKAPDPSPRYRCKSLAGKVGVVKECEETQISPLKLIDELMWGDPSSG